MSVSMMEEPLVAPYPWAGGKRRLLERMMPHLPTNDSYNTYYEPFLGSGVIFLAMRPKKAVISDMNPYLINTWKVIRNDVEGLISILKKYKTYNKKTFDKVVVGLNDAAKHGSTKRAAMFIYMMRNAYGSIWRTTKDGRISPSFNNGAKGKEFSADEDNLRNISRYMRSAKIKIMCAPYQKVVMSAKKNDFIYMDPPYMFTDAVSKVTYSKQDEVFDNDMLFDIISKLDKRGVSMMLSNSYHASLAKSLPSKFHMVTMRLKNSQLDRVSVARTGSKKKTRTEVIFYNYD